MKRHGKGSLIGKMPGDAVAEVRPTCACCSVTYAQPGKKMLFMGFANSARCGGAHDTSLE